MEVMYPDDHSDYNFIEFLLCCVLLPSLVCAILLQGVIPYMCMYDFCFFIVGPILGPFCNMHFYWG